MTRGSDRSGVRLLFAVALSLAFVASSVAISSVRQDRADVAPAGEARTEAVTPEDQRTDPAGPDAGGTPSPSPPAADLTVLEAPGAAEAAGPEAVLAAGLAAARDPWRNLGSPAWPARTERPVYVADVTVTPDRDAVEADVVVATRLAEDPAAEGLALRLFPAASAFGDNDLEVDVAVDGRRVDATVDRDAALLAVPLDAHAAGDAVLIRIRLGYTVPGPDAIADDGTPAEFGLLARRGSASTLGHWLPLLTFQPQAPVPGGDLGGFPPAVWSVVIHHDGPVVTGGTEDDCPSTVVVRARTCTWSRGVALREVAAVAYDAMITATTSRRGVEVRSVAAADDPTVTEPVNDLAALEAATSLDLFVRDLGPLAWTAVDVVAVPLGSGAAGMEFPGLVLIDSGVYDDLDGGFGTAVVVHEIAHQWFHALVGNGSLTDPVVDESLAQYLSYVYYAEVFGAGAAESLAEQAFLAPYLAARQAGSASEPPAQSLDAFADGDAYGALVYGRAALAWVEASNRLGADAVTAFLAALVEQRGLATITDDEVLDLARRFDPELGEILDRYWFSTDPLPGEEGPRGR